MSAHKADRRHETMLLTEKHIQDDDSSVADFERRIREKERDLELAAKIGKSLLDQNRELQERNEFLEESLRTSNDAVHQLQYQLQQRSALLSAFAEYDDQSFTATPTQEISSNFVERLESRVKELETENSQLKHEITELQGSSDDKHEQRVRNYLLQLEKATFKINKLQLQIAEKNQMCCSQENEIQRLMKEIGKRKEREEVVVQDNVDLQAELSTAARQHEELRSEIESLQEKYCEVLAVLNETQEELKTTRSGGAHKTSSLNSLYDSLASELEASDSGFYNTPMVSDRGEPNHRSTGLTSSSGRQELELFDHNAYSPSIKEPVCSDNKDCVTSTDTDALKLDMSTLTEKEYYDVPSKAIVDAVKRSMSATRRTRSFSHTPKGSADKVKEFPYRLLKTASPHGVSLQRSTKKELEPFDEEVNTDVVVESSPQPTHIAAECPGDKTFRNASCSPIRVETPPDEPIPRGRGPCTNSSVFFPYSGATSYIPNSSEDTASHLPSSSSQSSASGDEDETPRSSDSLHDYTGPKFGQPGSPGSRDLELALRKMRLQNKLEEQYNQFRKNRNLGSQRVAMRSGETGKPKITMGSLAARAGIMASVDRPSTLSIRPSIKVRPKSLTSCDARRDLSNNNLSRLNTSNSTRSQAINKSASTGFQLWQSSHIQQHQQSRGIDSAIREKMPLVCGVLGRSITPRQQSSEEPVKLTTPLKCPELQRQISGMSAGSQVLDIFGLSLKQPEQASMQALDGLLHFGRNAPSTCSLTDTYENDLSSALRSLNGQSNSIIERSSGFQT